MGEIDIKVLKGYIEGKDTMKELLVPAIEKLMKENEELKEQNEIKEKFEGKIEEINNEKLNYSEDEYYLENEIKGYAIDKMQELLDEIIDKK